METKILKQDFIGMDNAAGEHAPRKSIRERAIPLYKVGISQVADKCIGETEKHLQKIFNCAEENNVLLFFDEADALFGKRSEAKESKDRYANMEISYILQRIEQYGKIAILATNLRENIDAAFIRRIEYGYLFL